MLRRRPDAARVFDDVAGTVERLAALVRAGAAPATAWDAIADGSEDEAPLAAAVARRASAGLPLAPAFAALPADPRGDAWRRTGALLALAAETGAPLATALDRAAIGLRGGADLHRAVRAAVAGPAASARLTLLLPPGSAVLGWALGFDVPRVLLTPLGALAVLLATVLIAAAATWSRRLVRRAAAVRWQSGLGLDLVALALRAGLPLHGARLAAMSAARDVGIDLREDEPVIEAAARFAERCGVAVAPLLGAEADRVRRAVLADAGIAATVLGVRLLVPLGVLVLPAFLLAGALPVGLAILSSTALPI
ncbi:type II secretion system F family protein [Amnibacterium sp. CER49]|uniref:type II secretion system F family protein n=1 Tax=Amnibacterium sp. CER49 TaxID=3039161 RepID=UPI00244D32A2|nr:type II secretion system F family protein [Amnibacterium sp. CER49]MDH2443204.1 type II secretion system F family protein [Amnibacterium sp. CER49]